MQNQRSIRSANFDLVNTYFGIDVGHTYDGIDVTALMSDTLSAQKDRHMYVYYSDLFLQLDKRLGEVKATLLLIQKGKIHQDMLILWFKNDR